MLAGHVDKNGEFTGIKNFGVDQICRGQPFRLSTTISRPELRIVQPILRQHTHPSARQKVVQFICGPRRHLGKVDGWRRHGNGWTVEKWLGVLSRYLEVGIAELKTWLNFRSFAPLVPRGDQNPIRFRFDSFLPLHAIPLTVSAVNLAVYSQTFKSRNHRDATDSSSLPRQLISTGIILLYPIPEFFGFVRRRIVGQVISVQPVE